MATRTVERIRRHPIVSFFVLAFPWTWGYDELVYLGVAADYAFEAVGVLLVVYGPRYLAASKPTPLVPGSVPDRTATGGENA